MDDKYCQSSTARNKTTVHIFELLYCLRMLNCELLNIQKKINNLSTMLDFSLEILCIGRPLTRSIIIFVIQQPRELIRGRRMLLSEVFYFEMHWDEMHWSRVFWAEKNKCGYFYY